MLEFFSSGGALLVPLFQIIGVDVVLSGDNAVVIALAVRSLPPVQQKNAILLGSGAAIIMRILLTLTAIALLALPYLKLIGCVLLLWIGIQLFDTDDDVTEIKSSNHLPSAIRTIVMADVVMSLDNVLGIAAAAKGNVPLLMIGLAISIPFIVMGSKILLRLMQRFPVIITVGAALLGYVGGEMAVADPAIKDWVNVNFHALHQIVPVACALLILAVGKLRVMRKSALARR